MSAAFDPARRSREAELMDDDGTDYATFRDCLADLAIVNRLSLGYRPTLNFLERLNREGRLPRGRPLRIVDVGSGFGDMLREIACWARRAGVAVELIGIDRNPWAARAAAETSADGIEIVWLTADIFDFVPKTGIDVVVSALFTHHLDDAVLGRFLAWQDQTAEIGWFINDLHRHRLPFEFFRAASWALRMHRFVQHDGPVSFARSFVADDWRRALADAGVPDDAGEIRWMTPFRLCVSRIKAR